jgi:hypothetical protein
MKNTIIVLSIYFLFSFNVVSQSSYYSDSTVIEGNSFLASFDTELMKVTIKRNGDVLNIEGLLPTPDFEFLDFDNDGIKELVFFCIGCKADVLSIFDYDMQNKSFKLIENIDDFPAPKRIKETNYYYSYSPKGCADQNWESKLFTIDNFKAIQIGLIYAQGCSSLPDENIETKIEIFSNQNVDNLSLIETLPINITDSYKDGKWDFIRVYWTENFKKIIKTHTNNGS